MKHSACSCFAAAGVNVLHRESTALRVRCWQCRPQRAKSIFLYLLMCDSNLFWHCEKRTKNSRNLYKNYHFIHFKDCHTLLLSSCWLKIGVITGALVTLTQVTQKDKWEQLRQRDQIWEKTNKKQITFGLFTYCFSYVYTLYRFNHQYEQKCRVVCLSLKSCLKIAPLWFFSILQRADNRCCHKYLKTQTKGEVKLSCIKTTVVKVKVNHNSTNQWGSDISLKIVFWIKKNKT